MKRNLISGVVLLLAMGAVCAGYFIGYQRGFHRALLLQNGTFVGTLDVLQKLRAGETEAGTRRLENLCFSAANTVYSGQSGSQFVANAFADEFRSYRHRYRSNSVEWTVTEQNLEAKLVHWK